VGGAEFLQKIYVPTCRLCQRIWLFFSCFVGNFYANPIKQTVGFNGPLIVKIIKINKIKGLMTKWSLKNETDTPKVNYRCLTNSI